MVFSFCLLTFSLVLDLNSLELSRRVWTARGVMDPNCGSAQFFSNGPSVHFYRGLLQEIIPQFWPPELRSLSPP